MFSKLEILKLSKLINKDSSPNDVLNMNELEIITSVKLVKDSFFVPRHNRKVKTIIIKKLYTADFDLANFIERITETLRPSYEIRIGFSFIAHKSETELMYFFAIRPRPINSNNRIMENSSDVDNLLKFVSSFSRDELLNHVFEQNNSLNPFDRSGFRPKKIVLAVFWITKYAA